MVLDIIRDSTAGQVLNFISRGSLLPYADQRPDFVVPRSFLPPLAFSSEKEVSPSIDDTEGLTSNADVERGLKTPDTQRKPESTIVDHPLDSEIPPADPFLVGWYGDDDQENPR